MQSDLEKLDGGKSEANSNASGKTRPNWIEILKSLSDFKTTIISMGAAFLYISGFLVLTAHLYGSGVMEFNLINARYLVTGLVFLFYLFCFFIFGGRAIVLCKKWLAEEITQLQRAGAGSFWALVAFIHSHLHMAFMLCMSVAMFSAIALSPADTYFFYGILAAAFLVDYTLDVTNRDINFPRFKLIIDILIKISAIMAFFLLTNTKSHIPIFFTFFTFAVYINLVLDHFERYRVTKDWLIFTVLYTVFFFLSSSITFGGFYYGNVSRKIGGGLPIQATIGLSESLLISIGKKPGTGKVDAIDAKIIYESGDYTYLEIEKESIRINKSDIKWIKMKQSNEPVIPKAIESWFKRKTPYIHNDYIP